MNKFKIKKYFSLQTKITTGIVLFVFIFTGLISYLSYLNYIKSSREDLNMHLSTIVSMASLQIDGEKINLLKTKGDQETQAYKDVKKTLQSIKDSVKDIYYIYTMRENENNEIVFIVDPDELDPVFVGEVYNDPSEFLKNNFSTFTNTTVEKDFYTDKWGTWFSGYTPIYNKDNTRAGVLGIDLKASKIVEKENKIFALYLISFLLSGLFASLLGISLSKKITRSISSLSNMLKDEKNLEVFPDSNDEIGELKNAFETILDKNNESKIQIEERLLNESKTIDKINKVLASKEVEIAELKKEINTLKKV